MSGALLLGLWPRAGGSKAHRAWKAERADGGSGEDYLWALLLAWQPGDGREKRTEEEVRTVWESQRSGQ